MSAPSITGRKPKALSLGPLNYADGDEGYMADFLSQWDLDILPPSSRPATLTALSARALTSGPYDALIVLSLALRIDAEFLAPLLPHLRVVVSASAGYNEFDVPFMTAHGIWFCNARHAVAEATADMALFLTLAAVRDASRGERQAREGVWRGDIPTTGDPEGLVLGIIGMGSIGKHLARKASLAFSMRIAYHNRHQLPAAEEAACGNATYCPSLPDLLATADVLSINCPLNEDTRGLIGPAEFAAMKDGAMLVNTARGAVVDERALIAAMRSGKVSRVGLDVFPDEPRIHPFFAASDRCTLQPHLGGMTRLTFRKAERECCENLKAWATAGRPVGPVNEL